MRSVQKSVLFGALMSVAAVAQAVPVNYSFSGNSVGEFTGSGAAVFGNTIFTGATQVSGTFTYDSDTASLGYVPVAGYGAAPFANHAGAFSAMDMTVAGNAVSADVGLGLLGDNVAPGGVGAPLDVLLGYSAASLPTVNFAGFSTGGWQLTSFSFVFFNAANTFPGGALPDAPAGFMNLMEFFFANTQGQVQKVRYSLSNVQEVVAVPEPSTFMLLAMGLAGMLLRRRTA